MNAKLSFDAWQLWALSLTAKACVVMALAMLATYLMRRRPSAERHLVWVVAVAAVLTLPLSTWLLPSVRVSLSMPSWLSDVVQPATPSMAPVSVEALPTLAPLPVLPAIEPAPAQRGTRVTPTPAPTPHVSARPTERPAIVPAVAPVPSRSSASIFFIIWGGGVFVSLCAMLVGFARVYWYARRARALRDPALLVRARGIAAELGVGQRIRFLEGETDAMPMTFGVVRPTVLLPSVASSWTAARQETVLRHELAHIRRRDALTQLAAEVACALHWFNPLVWFAARRLYVEREHACDDLVIVSGSRAADYAAELVEIARSMRVQRAAPLAAIAMARPSQLRRRVLAVLEDRKRRALLTNRLLVPAWLGTFAIVLPLSSVAPRFRWPTPHREPVVAAKLERKTPSRVSQSQKSLTMPPKTRVSTSSWSATSPAQSAASVTASAIVGQYTPNPRSALAQLANAVATAHVRSPANRVTPAHAISSAQQECLANSRNRSINTNNNERRSTIKWSSDDCSGEVIIDGDVQFDADFTRITGLSSGGYIRITTDEGRTERRLQIEPGSGGLNYEYSVNGRRAEFDAAGQQWLNATMLFLFRRIGFMAEQRANAILSRGGANAVLTEVSLLQGDYPRSRYLAVLVEKGQLDEGSLRRVLELAGNTLSSDHYRTEVITAVAGRYEFTDGIRQAYIDAATRIRSDHYKHAAFTRVLDKGNLPPAQVSAVLGAAGQISSDHYRSELLRSAAQRYALAPDIRGAYLTAATGIKSDHYKTIVLDAVMRSNLSAAELARVVDASMSVESDHYRAELLTKIGGMDLRDAALQAAFVRAASDITSDHYKAQVLTKAAAGTDLDRVALLGILDAAATIKSDHYLSELLVDVARRHRLEGDTRERFMRALDSIGSSHYHGQVATALLRQTR